MKFWYLSNTHIHPLNSYLESNKNVNLTELGIYIIFYLKTSSATTTTSKKPRCLRYGSD
jgi:hypothetical protein